MNLKTSITSLFILLIVLPFHLLAQNTACPPNLDFEQGNLSNWEFYTGTCCPTSTNLNTGPIGNRHTLTSGAGTDPYGGFPVVAPGGGNYSLRLGNNGSGGQAERARYYVQVPNNQNNIYTLLYSYAVVFQNPGHSQADQPRFEVTVFDSATGTPVQCNQFTFVSGVGLPGFQNAGNGVLYKPWATSSIDLSSMAGRTVAIDFTSGDCALGGHFGYAYIDVACNFFQSHTLYCPSTTTYTLTAPPGFETYEWRDASLNTVLGTTANLTIPTPTSSTQFAVILKPYPGFGCPDTLFTTFNIANMTIDITPDTSVCAGNSIKLYASTNSTSSPFTYSWTPPSTLSCNNCDSPIATPAVTMKYLVTIVDRDGCDATDSVLVRVDERVTAKLQVGDTFCAFDKVEAINNAINPAGSDFLWTLPESDGNVIAGLGNDTVIAVWQTPGFKKIKVSVINGLCSESDSADLYIAEKPIADFEVNDDVCLDESTQLRPYPHNALYFWSIDNHSFPSTDFVDILPLSWSATGEKRVFLKVENQWGCTDTKEEFVGVHAFPIAEIIPISADKLCKGKQFELAATTGQRYDFSWSPPQYFSNNKSESVRGTVETEGYVYLDVTNQWFCTSRDSFFIDGGLCCDIFMPDAFTPDNNGWNDTYWSPDLNRVQVVQFFIANRRGQVVYDYKTSPAWDGSYNGKPAAQDTYNYYVRYVCDDEEIIKKGTLILLR